MSSLLLDRGAEPNAADEFNGTPIARACQNGHTEVVRLLLDRGASLQLTDGLAQACSRGHTKLADFLLDKGADPTAQNDSGWTPLTYLLSSPLDDRCAEPSYVKLALRLIDRMTDFECVDSGGKTLLHFASSNGYQEVVRRLVEKGAKLDARDGFGRTPLHVASDAAMEKLLTKLGADPNSKDNSGKTADILIQENDILAGEQHAKEPSHEQPLEEYYHDLVLVVLSAIGRLGEELYRTKQRLDSNVLNGVFDDTLSSLAPAISHHNREMFDKLAREVMVGVVLSLYRGEGLTDKLKALRALGNHTGDEYRCAAFITQRLTQAFREKLAASDTERKRESSLFNYASCSPVVRLMEAFQSEPAPRGTELDRESLLFKFELIWSVSDVISDKTIQILAGIDNFDCDVIIAKLDAAIFSEKSSQIWRRQASGTKPTFFQATDEAPDRPDGPDISDRLEIA